MPKNKPRRLNEVVNTHAPQGANDAKWFLVEHQLGQARLSVEFALSRLENIVDYPENQEERSLAIDARAIVQGLLTDVLEHKAQLLSYLSDTDVPERISRKEV